MIAGAGNRPRIEGYAIVAADGMLADRNRHMHIDADQRFFTNALDRAALVVHGRHFQEQQGAASDRRRRDKDPGKCANDLRGRSV